MVNQGPVTVLDEDPQPDHPRQLSNEAAPEDNKSSDRVSEHLHMHLLASSPTCCTSTRPFESATVELQSRVSNRSRSPQRKESRQEQSPQKQKGRKPWRKSKSRVSRSPWIQTKTMKNLKMSLELLQTHSAHCARATSPARTSCQFTSTNSEG